MIHELKTWNNYFVDLSCGIKTFELRKDDRGFKVGDVLWLREWNDKTETYTGMSLHRKIDYILKGGKFGLEAGFVILGISKL